MIGGGDLMGEVLNLANDAGDEIAEHYHAELRPHLARILTDAAAVEIRRASGEDVTTAEIAVKASLSNLTLEQADVALAAARRLAFRAALVLITKLLPAA